MISRAHGLVLCLLLGAAATTGAYALIATTHLGDAETKPEVVSSRQIAQRARKLDAWEASLQKALQARPPALPPLNRYASVQFVAAPGPSTLPTPISVSRRAAQQPTPSGKTTKKPVARPEAKRPSKGMDADATPNRDDDASDDAAPVEAPEHSTPSPAPEPAAAVVVAAAAPAPAPAPSAPPETQSVEQQCRALLRAAENKGERAKQEAERQCEALKQAAEKDD